MLTLFDYCEILQASSLPSTALRLLFSAMNQGCCGGAPGNQQGGNPDCVKPSVKEQDDYCHQCNQIYSARNSADQQLPASYLAASGCCPQIGRQEQDNHDAIAHCLPPRSAVQYQHCKKYARQNCYKHLRYPSHCKTDRHGFGSAAGLPIRNHSSATLLSSHLYSCQGTFILEYFFISAETCP